MTNVLKINLYFIGVEAGKPVLVDTAIVMITKPVW